MDPVKGGALLKRTRDAKPKPWPCPSPEFLQDGEIEKVATRYCGGVWLEAREMLHRTPGLFYRLLGWCHVKDDGEIEGMKYDAAKARTGAGGSDMPKTLGSK